ncbi:MAG: DUF262 domain-containing protein [Alphaproteobacteria bacterium]|nr:DUF262 domain-containing protein [Alphaproteobacteria bacterium]
MAKEPHPQLEFDDEADEQDVAEHLRPGSTAAVVTGTDWTTETIVSQLKRGNIQLDPRFQRRDAWKKDRKSRFIESLIVGLPIPQIVLAESKRERGKFIVLDGKQRLLTIMQFWGHGQGDNNAYALSSLTLRDDLIGQSFKTLSKESTFESDFNALCNQPIRTVVIRNWKDTDFLHTVFLRLNTGSVTLSPQELRQALLPGEFSNYIDDSAGSSKALRRLLGINGPDTRMRDTEILARFLAFRFFANKYPGRMKKFLDNTFEEFNDNWSTFKPKVEQAVAEFELGVASLLKVFDDRVARKPTSPQFNRAIFDALIYFQSQPRVRTALKSKNSAVKKAYQELFISPSPFLKAVESDTAGAPNTSARLRIWAKSLSTIAEQTFTTPKIPVPDKPAPREKNAA